VRRRWKARRGALFVVTGLLVTSGLVRFGDETGRAIAEANLSENLALEQEMTVGAQNCLEPKALDAILAAINTREDRVMLREGQLADRIQALAVAEAEIAAQIAILETAEKSLAETISIAESATDDDLIRLTSVYENMKPKDAAALFEEMASEFAAGFLARMRADSAAAIMAGLEPTTAYAISLIIAGRNAQVPRE